jgi:site-specific DNA recombinase
LWRPGAENRTVTNLFDGFPPGPRRGSVLWVLIIARISTLHQDARSLDDQAALCEKYVRDRYPGPVRFTHIQGRGSGEFLDRSDLAHAEAAVESGEYDLVIVEDLGRVCRRNRAIDFCELCEDAVTRFVAINDSIDTARDDWRLNAFFASFKHESGNKDTAKRIRRSLRHRFEQGGVVQTFPYGYVKPPGATSDADVARDTDAAEVYEHVFAMLEGGASYAEAADWMNARGVPTGRWARSKAWDGRMVARVVHNPILKGFRRRNERTSRRVNRTGRRKSVQAPTGERLYRHAPHLGFIEPSRYDRLIADLARRHAACARGRKAGTPDARAGVPKRRTVWPGQHVTCGVCGRPYYWGGHGQAGRLMCSGCRDYTCWNAATFDGTEAGARLVAAVLSEVEALPEFDDAFRARVEAAARARRSGRADAVGRLDQGIAEAGRELSNVVDAIAQVGYSAALKDRLAEAEARKAGLEAERADLLRQPDEVPPLPPVAELKARARAAAGRMAFDDPAFARLTRQLVPEIEVFPHRLVDGGAVVLRALVTVNVGPLLGPSGDAVGSLVTRTVMVDLFDAPQRAAFRERVAALRGRGYAEREAARELGLTVTAAQRAVALHRMMLARGLTDPYQPLLAPPGGGGKFCRHEHARYQFRPLDGYPAWPGWRAA